MLTEQATSGGLKAPMFRASKLTFLLKAPDFTDFNLMPMSPLADRCEKMLRLCWDAHIKQPPKKRLNR